jgi:hypothetical protein
MNGLRQVAPRLVGPATLVRYADDLVIIFAYERDARRVLDVLPKRLAKYGLMLHPEKTRLIDFERPDRRSLTSPDSNGDACSRPGTFDLLGFTHYWGMSRKGYNCSRRRQAPPDPSHKILLYRPFSFLLTLAAFDLSSKIDQPLGHCRVSEHRIAQHGVRQSRSELPPSARLPRYQTR